MSAISSSAALGTTRSTAEPIADLLATGDGDDVVHGGIGMNVVVAGTGNDAIDTGSDRDFIDAGSGNDVVTADAGSDFIVGGAGSYTVDTGVGQDLIAFNRGDGADTIVGAGVDRDTLSLGGGIRYADISLRKVGNDLVLDLALGDSISFTGWYTSSARRSVDALQMVVASADYSAASPERTKNRKIVTFDFANLANRFDQLLAATPGMTSWAVAAELDVYFKASSDTQAIGGDLASRYANTGSYGDLTWTGVRNQMTGLTGTAFQTLTASTAVNPWTALQAGVSSRRPNGRPAESDHADGSPHSGRSFFPGVERLGDQTGLDGRRGRACPSLILDSELTLPRRKPMSDSVSPAQAEKFAAAKKELAKLPLLGPAMWLYARDQQLRFTFIADLDWRLMPPLVLDQCRLYSKSDMPWAFATWAFVSDVVDERLRSNPGAIAPHEWKAGTRPWLIDVVAPFGDIDTVAIETAGHMACGGPRAPGCAPGRSADAATAESPWLSLQPPPRRRGLLGGPQSCAPKRWISRRTCSPSRSGPQRACRVP